MAAGCLQEKASLLLTQQQQKTGESGTRNPSSSFLGLFVSSLICLPFRESQSTRVLIVFSFNIVSLSHDMITTASLSSAPIRPIHQFSSGL